ncbi:hypothetical protein HF995_03815 [Sanguibacter hominis ATCC BAA-789]|uniref:Lipoprotein n=1 Tax=Sanguibacter hominis ATCC BAA-789 TaxID=1312740 RepID=A0A9X5FCY6_9MICO|nr:hypothetical protein [Sanguibacter hominis]NKX92407.1 hypothetical protein [Sanguibacter hominis ATCC BAA-789]
MRRGMGTGIAVLALSALAACTAEEPAASPGVTTPPGGVASPAVTTPAPEEPILAWADGTPVDGPTIDIDDAVDVRLGEGVMLVSELRVAEGWRPAVVDLRPDGTYLAVDLEGDASPGGGPDGYGPLRLVGAHGTTTLRSPGWEVSGMVDPGTLARFVDGGVAWVERSVEGPWRLLYAPDGEDEGRVVAEGDGVEIAVRALGRSAAYDDRGGALGWDGTRVPRSSDAPDVWVTPGGNDLLVNSCTDDGCEVSVENPEGSSTPLVRAPGSVFVRAADEQHVVVQVAVGEDDSQVWVLDRTARTAVRLLGADPYEPGLDDGRVLMTGESMDAEGEHELFLVDVVEQRSERLPVDRLPLGLSLAGDLAAWTASGPAGADGVGGAILSWPHGD